MRQFVKPPGDHTGGALQLSGYPLQNSLHETIWVQTPGANFPCGFGWHVLQETNRLLVTFVGGMGNGRPALPGGMESPIRQPMGQPEVSVPKEASPGPVPFVGGNVGQLTGFL